MKWNFLFQITAASRTPDYGATAPRSPFSLSSVLSWICWNPPPNKIPGYATGLCETSSKRTTRRYSQKDSHCHRWSYEKLVSNVHPSLTKNGQTEPVESMYENWQNAVLYVTLFIYGLFSEAISGLVYVAFNGRAQRIVNQKICEGSSGVPRNFVWGEGGGVHQIQLRTEDRENGDLGAVAP